MSEKMNISTKIQSRAELGRMRATWRKQGKTVGFTSGSFDLIHAGHAAYLEKAKEKCDILLVGVNTDSSVKKYKGENRPILPEKERLWLIAALGSVDYAFLFDERRNNVNIDVLRPDYYIKAGDYREEELTSKELVESYGGRVMLIPIEFKISTSDIIGRILLAETGSGARPMEEQGCAHIPLMRTKTCRTVFLDRDGTINIDVEYLHEPEKFRLTPNALAGLKRMQAMGFKLVIITTQAGIGLGYFTKEDFYRVNREMFRQLASAKVIIERIYFCPHSLGDNCDCRKPKTALFERARQELCIDMQGSYMIGDKTSDIEAGRRAGCRTILLKTDRSDTEYKVKPDHVAADLLDAAKYILEQERNL
jgi:D-glycero-D-manno-heptose 1,7-bisphosphate phosphatase